MAFKAREQGSARDPYDQIYTDRDQNLKILIKTNFNKYDFCE